MHRYVLVALPRGRGRPRLGPLLGGNGHRAHDGHVLHAACPGPDVEPAGWLRRSHLRGSAGLRRSRRLRPLAVRRHPPHPPVHRDRVGGPARGGHRLAAGPLLFRLQRGLLRDRHVGRRGGRAPHRREHPGDGRRLRDDGHLGCSSAHRHRITGTYLLALCVAVGSVLLVYFLLRSRVGLALTAIRDNDLAAQSSGVNVFRSKLLRLSDRRLRVRRRRRRRRDEPAPHPAQRRVQHQLDGLRAVHRRDRRLRHDRGTDHRLRHLLRPAPEPQPVRDHLHAPARGHRRGDGDEGAAGIWGFIEKRWHIHLFPVRRRLVFEASPPGDDERRQERRTQPLQNPLDAAH